MLFPFPLVTCRVTKKSNIWSGFPTRHRESLSVKQASQSRVDVAFELLYKAAIHTCHSSKSSSDI